jgi:hypothetical protein
MKLHGYDLDGLSRYRASFQQLHRKGSRKLGFMGKRGDHLAQLGQSRDVDQF